MRIAIIAVLLMALPAAVFAQNPGERKGWGYGYAGFGGSSAGTAFHVGGGGEILLASGFGLGAEAARFGATSRFANNSVTVISAGLSYHFGARHLSRKLVPFMTGGLSLANSRSGGGNFGGGVQYWVHERVGLRLEFREHIFSSDSPFISAIHVGLAFR